MYKRRKVITIFFGVHCVGTGVRWHHLKVPRRVPIEKEEVVQRDELESDLSEQKTDFN